MASKQKLIDSFNRSAAAAFVWQQRHGYYHGEIVRLVRSLVPPHATLLEIGSGTGELLASVPAMRRTGIDISTEALALGRRNHPNVVFIEDDAESLKTTDRFDYVLLSELIGSLIDIEAALRGAHRVMDDRGRLVIVWHNYLWQPLIVVAERLHLKARSPIQNWVTFDDLENFLYLAGFETVRSGQRMLCPYRIPVLAWFLNRIVARFPLMDRLCLLRYLVARPVPRGEPKRPSVSVVIAARNEKGNIERIVERMPTFPAPLELIFVEGHSRDGTWEEIQRMSKKYQGKVSVITARQDGVGKGDAIRKGFSLASGEALMVLDADMTVAPEDLPRFYRAFAEGRGELINGSRLVYQMEQQAMRFLNIIGNKFFAAAFSWLLSQRIKDTLCGTKVLARSDYERIAANRAYFGDFDPFGDFDLLFGAAKLNLKIIDLPIRYRERTYGTTQIQRFRHGWLLLKMAVFAARKLKFQP